MPMRDKNLDNKFILINRRFERNADDLMDLVEKFSESKDAGRYYRSLNTISRNAKNVLALTDALLMLIEFDSERAEAKNDFI